MLGLYCNRVEIVFQEGLLESCVAIQCIVLQQAARLVRKICIAIHLLYCDRKARQQARAGALGRRRACWGVRGRAGGSWAQQALGAGRAGALQASGRAAGARGERQARQGVAAGAGARGAGLAGRHALGAGRVAWARGLGARPRRWALGLGAWAGQDCALGALDLIFNPIFRLGIFPDSVNEHCSL